ncbi:MAG: GNAT family N-acetyltransferase [Candidatus Paceibacterota bacterium]
MVRTDTEFNYEIRKFNGEKDIENGLLDVLSQLTVSSTKEEALAAFKKISQQGISHIFVAILPNEKVIGTASLIETQRLIRGGAIVGHIEDVVVDEKYRRRGVGTQLLQRCVDQAKDIKGCYKVILDARKKYVSFYENLGFLEKEVHMRLDLET